MSSVGKTKKKNYLDLLHPGRKKERGKKGKEEAARKKATQEEQEGILKTVQRMEKERKEKERKKRGDIRPREKRRYVGTSKSCEHGEKQSPGGTEGAAAKGKKYVGGGKGKGKDRGRMVNCPLSRDPEKKRRKYRKDKLKGRKKGPRERKR